MSILCSQKIFGSKAENWTRAGDAGTAATLKQFLEITDLLFEQVQLNSTHLFRADILHDSLGKLQTISDKSTRYSIVSNWFSLSAESDNDIDSIKSSTKVEPGDTEAHYKTEQNSAPTVTVREDSQVRQAAPPTPFEGYEHQRTVIRRLIPRKPQLDKPLEQTCFIYSSISENGMTPPRGALVVYVPHCTSPESMPWYHPKVQGIACQFSCAPGVSTLCVHYLPFPDSPITERTERTMKSLLNTSIRLLKMPSKTAVGSQELTEDVSRVSLAASALKDTILPQHVVQDTYTRLKETYASDLIKRWVESTEPSKHVFEDLSIAAFLIELWHTMYKKSEFPGFVDIACGNGVLTYVLSKEGWRGHGFDARRRKTWDVLDMDNYLDEAVCIPQPFLDTCNEFMISSMKIHNGSFPAGTFIISNHADELTCWTPILAAISQPSSPLPFLAIPCCSHALDGSKHRYTLKEVVVSTNCSVVTAEEPSVEFKENGNGDLKALRAEKQARYNHTDPADKSMYACLTRKTAAIAQELGSEVDLTLMRIPSTRNIGIIGNMRGKVVEGDTMAKIDNLLLRECASVGGVDTAAQTWVEKSKRLQQGQGRGKVNWNGPKA